MDSLNTNHDVEDNHNNLAETSDAIESLSLNIKDIVTVIDDSRASLQSSLETVPMSDVTSQDKALLDISASDITYSFVDTLRHNGIENLEIDASALSDPRSALQTVFETGDASLREEGIPPPDVAFYNKAMETAQSSGQDFHDVISDMRAEQPLMMRQDILPRDSIDLMDASDIVNAALDIEGPVAETQYDVHAMGFPIASPSVLGVSLPSSASHGFVVITERGMDPTVDSNVLLATRAGPDHLAARTMFTSDSSLPADMPSETEKTHSGNVYVSDHLRSVESDVEHEHAFLIKTYEVDYDLETMTNLVDSHARMINFADIDYELLNRNSNTYYGDITEILTGEEPPDYSFSGGLPRYFPAINNDLTDYSKTEFAESFGYERAETEINTNDSSYAPEEDYSYGLD